MRSLFFASLFWVAFSVQANCDERWNDLPSNQIIHSYKVNKKVFFHSSPENGSKVKDLFLIPGDKFESYLNANGFSFGNFFRKDGSVVMGWLKSDALTAQAEPTIRPLNEADFRICSPNGEVVLDEYYEKFNNKWGRCAKSEQLESGVWSNYISKGDEIYKYFMSYWKGFTIRSSNINYKAMGSDFDTYRITTVALTNKKYMTNRGLSLGMTLSDVINAYGEPSERNTNEVIYIFKNYTLEFGLKDNSISGIMMNEEIL